MTGKVVVASSGFKGTLTPLEVNASIADQLTRTCAEKVDLILKPLADGGENSLDVLSSHFHSTPTQKKGPFNPFLVPSTLNTLSIGRGSIMFEVAPHLSARTPGDTMRSDADFLSSRGLGNVIKELLRQNPSSLTLGLGGAETYDGGAGAMQAFGANFRDREGRVIDFFDSSEPIPTKLNAIYHVNLASKTIDLLQGIRISLLCDSALTLSEAQESIEQKLPSNSGKSQSAKVFAVIRGLQNLARVLSRSEGSVTGTSLSDTEVRSEPWQRRGLASGGAVATSLNLALGADLSLGSRYVANTNNLREAIRGSVAVITGEGNLDPSSLRGKAVSSVLEIAEEFSVPVYGLVGSIHPSLRDERESTSIGPVSRHDNLAKFRAVYELFPDNPTRSKIRIPSLTAAYLAKETPNRIAISINDLCQSPFS